MVFVSTQLYGQTPKINFGAERSLTEVTENNFETTRIQLSFEGLNYLNVETREGTFTELIMPRGYSVGELGTPKLPASKKLVEIPFGAEVSVKVTAYTTEEYRLSDFGVEHPLMPVQPSLRKDQDVNEVPFEYVPEKYSKRSYIEPELASVEVLGVMRGQRLGRLTVAPVQYNPSEGTIRVYNNIELEIQYSGSDQALTNYIKASTYSPYFDVVYNRVINPFGYRDVFDDHPDLTKYPIKMVIVSHPDFEETLEPFIEWKTMQGFEIIEGYTDDIGSTPSAIQTFIHDQYNAGTPEDPAPTFVIVVGDPGKLPASATGSASGRVTDLYYASVDGDYFPEMYIGRLSARNVQELQNQLDKILYYQKYEFTDPSYLNDVTLIAGADGTWNPRIGQPTVHYGTDNYFNAAHGFANVNAYLDSYTGCYDEERISVSLINFTAHCSSTSWASPTLSVTDVHNMTNTGKYPLAIGNCCQSALFSHAESIGEAWVRAEEKGAVAYIGSAPNTHWFEDFYWAVGAFPIQGNNNGYVPTTDETTLGAYDAPFVSDYLAVASTKFVGNLAITEAHLQNYPTHSNVQWYWEGYHTFGDPSTVIYLTEGEENDVTHMPIVPIGLDTYTVEALPGSYVAISMNGVLHGAAFVDGTGEVDVPIDPILDGGDVTIVVTKPQYIPYVEEVPAAALEGPYVVMDEYLINDPGQTGNANYGEAFTIDLTLKNVGADPVSEVTATLAGEDDYISLLDGDTPVEFDGMDAGETGNTSTVEDAFSFEVSMNVPDQHQATFILTVSDGEEEWTSNLRITANAPVFSIDPNYVLDDSEGGDGNGRLDPGETGTLTFTVINHGHATALNPVIQMDGNSPYLTIEQNELDLDPIPAGDTVEVVYTVSAHEASPEGTPVDLNLVIEDGYWFETETLLIIGQVPELVIGDGTDVPSQFPFYNYYKANRTQMLYRAGQIGEGDKTITELGMELVHATSTSQHQVLPNFKIMIKTTDMESLGTSYVNMDDAVVVFDEENHQMPTETGWHVFDIDNYEYDGSSNLIIEIIWGMLDTWCSFGDHYRVNGTTMESTRVVYGRSDTSPSPPYTGNSNILPNLFMAFAAEETEEVRELSFLVKDEEDNILENAGITIGSLTKHTGEEGTTYFNLMPGTYHFKAAKAGYFPFEDDVLLEEDLTIEVILSAEELYTVTFNIENQDGETVENAMVTLDGTENEPGDYVFADMEPGTYSYLIEKEGYFEYSGSLTITDEDVIMDVTLEYDDTGLAEVSEFKLEVYPNPTRGLLNVRLQAPGDEAKVTLLNYQGQLISSKQVSLGVGQNDLQFNLDGFAPGIYYLRVNTAKEIKIEKIILQ